MQPLDLNDVINYVEENIGSFHDNRIKKIQTLKLDAVLKRKNPYLFKAKNVLTAQDLVKVLLDAYLSSQEETIFGEFLEGLAIFVCQKVYGGKKSAAAGIDLEFEKNDRKYIVSIKSGPHWGNSSQINKMKDNFRTAKKILGTNALKQNVVAVNGCCYGKDANPDKGEYLKLCGQDFWEFISEDDELYMKIIEPLGYEAKKHNELFEIEYAKVINEFVKELSDKYMKDSLLDWEKLVKFNSERKNKK